MNLVEQLGGYEKAKTVVDKAPCKTYTYHNHPYQKGYIRCWGGDGKEYFLVSDIEQALLDHRRQHNIFEQGDPVVSRCADNETRIFTYQETIGKNILVKCKKGKGYCYPKKWFSHANDAEIKAGRRL